MSRRTVTWPRTAEPLAALQGVIPAKHCHGASVSPPKMGSTAVVQNGG